MLVSFFTTTKSFTKSLTKSDIRDVRDPLSVSVDMRDIIVDIMDNSVAIGCTNIYTF